MFQPLSADPAGDLFSESAITALQAHEGFMAAVEAAALGTLAFYKDIDPTFRWVFQDRGRYMTGLAALALLGMGQLTAANLKILCAGMSVSSPGRTTRFLDRMRNEGHLRMTRMPDGGLDRHLTPSPAYLDHFRRHRRIMLDALGHVAPDLAATTRPMLDGPDYPSLEAAICGAQAARREVFQTRPEDPMFPFIERNIGLIMLFDLQASQRQGRERLLEDAPLSVSGLARRHGASRVHINTLLAEAARRDLVRVDDETRRVIFAPALSDAYARTSALLLQSMRAGCVTALAAHPL